MENFVLDGSSVTLGDIPDGIVGGVRCSVYSPGPVERVWNFGPFDFGITNHQLPSVYPYWRANFFNMYKQTVVPQLYLIPTEVRNFLERHLQLQMVKMCENSLLLFDGVLQGTTDTPRSYMDNLLTIAYRNSNDVIGVSKQTSLTLEATGQNILTLLDGTTDPCFVRVDPCIRTTKKHLTEIFVAKLTTEGLPFRIDVFPSSKTTSEQLLEEISGISDNSGYPRPLKMAHIYCTFTAPEVLALQTCAIKKYRMVVEEGVRSRIFAPWR